MALTCTLHVTLQKKNLSFCNLRSNILSKGQPDSLEWARPSSLAGMLAFDRPDHGVQPQHISHCDTVKA